MAAPTFTTVPAITGYIPAGRRKYQWITTLASITAPTSAELSVALSDITPWIVPSSISGFTTTSATVDDPNMSTRTVAKVPGMVAFADSSLEFRLSVSGTSDARALFHRDDVGYMCIYPEGNIASGKMSIFLCTVTSASTMNGAGDSISTFAVGFAVTNAAENIAIPTA